MNGLMERLAAKWAARVMSPEWPDLCSDTDDARFFILAIADEIERTDPSDHGNGSLHVAEWLRAEAER